MGSACAEWMVVDFLPVVLLASLTTVRNREKCMCCQDVKTLEGFGDIRLTSEAQKHTETRGASISRSHESRHI